MEDKIINSHVTKWIKSTEVINANLDRLEDDEREAYLAIKDLFSKNRPNLEILVTQSETLKNYLDGGVKDEVYTGVRDFLKTSDIAKDNFQAFKEILEDKGYFAPVVPLNMAAPNDFNGSGTVLGTASYQRVQAPNGEIYEGLFLDGQRVSKGKINYPDGSVYEGEWNSQGPHGEGMLILKRGENIKYTGRFENNHTGYGRIEWADGVHYEGGWSNYETSGIGTMYIGDRVDKGEYTNGCRTGKGRMEWQNGDWYEGGWNDKGANGYGTYKIGNRIDKGEYTDGCRTGQGRMEWDDGDWYEGGWNDKGEHGYGTKKVGNRIDKGQYSNGCRTGEGRMEWEDGDWYEGGWNDKGEHGKGTYYNSKCKRLDQGTWKNGVSVGSVYMKWDNGNWYRGTWSYDSEGRMSGEGKYYDVLDKKARSGKWVNGNWENKWSTPRNIGGTILIVLAVLSLVGGAWIQAIILGLVGKWVYEGK